MKTFPSLSAPQFAGLVERARCNLVSKFNKEERQQGNMNFSAETLLWMLNWATPFSRTLQKFSRKGSLPVGVVERDRIHHVSVTLQHVQLRARGRVPDSACPVITPSYEPAEWERRGNRRKYNVSETATCQTALCYKLTLSQICQRQHLSVVVCVP